MRTIGVRGAVITAVLGTLQGCGSRQGIASTPLVTYAAQLRACLATSSTCERYIACRHHVQAAHGQPLTGSCAEVTQ